MENNQLTAIIILNWNGAADTIACLESLYTMDYHDYFMVVVDNGSSDGSVREITTWLSKKDKKCIDIKEGDSLPDSIESESCIVYSLTQNYGFAKGNNLGMGLICDIPYTHLLLLNNDTIVEPDFLCQLNDFQLSHPTYKVLTPLILYASDKYKIWNAGGRICCDMRKYYYANQSIHAIHHRDYIPITFITGCALFCLKDLLKENTLFTERFFFGEEDFDFSLRMKKKQIKMACVLHSKIYHKVGNSTANVQSKNKIYLYYLNRFLNVKYHRSALYNFIWKHIYFIYIIMLLSRNRYSLNESMHFISRLKKDTKKHSGVTQAMFYSILKEKN